MTVGYVAGTNIGAVTVVVVGAVVVGVVAVVAEVPEVLAERTDAGVDFDAVVGVGATVAATVVRRVTFNALLVVPPASDARPANRPVPVSAPASDQRVSCLIRRNPASRFLRLRRFSAWRFMVTIVVRRPKCHLGSR
jgi:hypothetical protein